MISNLIIIGIGGFLGSITRYLFFLLDEKFYSHTRYPMGTLFVNLIGSFLIGIALGLSVKYNLFNRGSFSHFLFVTGFLGSFSTFSTFSQDSFQLLTDGHYIFLITAILLNVVGGIMLTALGYFLIS